MPLEASLVFFTMLEKFTSKMAFKSKKGWLYILKRATECALCLRNFYQRWVSI